LEKVIENFVCPKHPHKPIRCFDFDASKFGCYDCMDDFLENHHVERVKSVEMAKEFIKQSPKCFDHSLDVACYCYSDGRGACWKCIAETCSLQNHRWSLQEIAFDETLARVLELKDRFFDNPIWAEILKTWEDARQKDMKVLTSISKSHSLIPALNQKWGRYFKEKGLSSRSEIKAFLKSVSESRYSLNQIEFLENLHKGSLSQMWTHLERLAEYLEVIHRNKDHILEETFIEFDEDWGIYFTQKATPRTVQYLSERVVERGSVDEALKTTVSDGHLSNMMLEVVRNQWAQTDYLRCPKFEDFGLKDDGAIALQKAMAIRPVYGLFLKGNFIGDEGLKALGSVLGEDKSLQIIDLSHNSIMDTGIAKLCAGLRQNRILIELKLHMNKITGEGTKILVKAIEGHPTLQKLDLHCNSLRDVGAIAYAHLLKTNKMIDHIKLSQNYIGDEGAKALFSAINRNPYITTVDLSRRSHLPYRDCFIQVDSLENEFGNDENVRLIAECVSGPVGAKYFLLSQTKIEKGVSRIRDALLQSPRVKKVDVRGNNLGLWAKFGLNEETLAGRLEY